MNSNSDKEIVSSRVLHAPLEVAFRSFADPLILAKWWGPEGFTNTIHEFDLREGGLWRLTMHGPEQADYENAAIFTNVVPNQSVAWTRTTSPHFDMEVLFEALDPFQTKIAFRMIFKSIEVCAKMKDFVIPKNEENFDRLERELIAIM